MSKPKLVTTPELLNMVAAPFKEGSAIVYNAVEAELLLEGGLKTTHVLCFEDASPVRKRRRFWHEAHGGSGIVTEKRLLEMYGKATWRIYL